MSTGATDDRIVCATWNIHRAKGSDGRIDPDRVCRALVEEVCIPPLDILALQEADTETPPHAGILDLEGLCAATGLRHAQSDRSLRWGVDSHGFLGAVLFHGPDISVGAAQVIDLPGHCHRGAVLLDAVRAGRQFRVITTHLSLSQALRMVQMRTIGQVLRRLPPMQTILLGDLNEWRPWGGMALAPGLVGRALRGPARATFPVRRPLLPLDRILSDRAGAVGAVSALDGPGIRAASDHRPLRGEVRLDPAPPLDMRPAASGALPA